MTILAKTVAGLLFVAAWVVLLMTLAGCAGTASNPTGEGGTYGVSDVVVGDRTVVCVTWRDNDAGGLSCDWANTNPAPAPNGNTIPTR